MSVLEEEDPCSLVEYEDVLKHETIEGFVKIIQRRFSLKHVTYMCPSFAGRERKDPVLATTYSDEWVRHYKEQDYGMIDPTITIGARSSLSSAARAGVPPELPGVDHPAAGPEHPL